jgi:hypothetical protein
VIQSCYGLLALVSFGKIFPDFCEAVLTSTRMFYLVRKLINDAHFCNMGSSSVGENKGYGVLIQTGAELVFCRSFPLFNISTLCSMFCISACLWFSIALAI